MRFRVLIISILIILTTVGCSSTNNLSKEDKLADFEQLYNEIKNGYPFLEVNKRQNKIDWLANKETYKDLIEKTSSDQDFAEKLNSILQDLNSGHTEVITEKAYFDMFKEVYGPLGWYDFFDDENVNNMYNSFKDKGKPMSESFKDIEMKDLVKDKIGYIYIPQMNSANGSIDDDMKRIESYLRNRQNYKALVINIRGNTGGTDEYWTKLVSILSDKKFECGGYNLVRNNSDVINNYTKARKVKLNDINELPKNIIKKAPKEVTSMFTHFEENKLTVEGKSKTPFKGKIYLLVDDFVYSGAESFSIFCKEQNFATIVGTKTGGDGYVYDPVLFKLNNSGLIVRMSSAMYITDSGICNEEEKTTPDVKIENNSKRLEPYIDKVLELENEK